MSAGHSKSARLTVFARDDWTCRHCGFRQTEEERREAAIAAHTGAATFKQWLTLDHIVPWSKGGSHRMENLQTLCNICNGKKDNLLDPADVIPIRLRPSARKRIRKMARLVHDPRCDSTYCFHLCPVYLAQGAVA